MDYYALTEKKINELKFEIIDYIREVLVEEKGYKIGERAYFYDDVTHHRYAFEILEDKILFGEAYEGNTYYNHAYNIEYNNVEELKELLHKSYHVRKNN